MHKMQASDRGRQAIRWVWARRAGAWALSAAVALGAAHLASGRTAGGGSKAKTPDIAKPDRPAKSETAKAETPKAGTQPTMSSMIEDRAARKLLAAGDARLELEQAREGLELYQQVVERYPRSQVRFEAFGRIAKYHLEKSHEPAKALPYYERAADRANENADLRGEAMLGVGRCFYEMQKYPQAFASLRAVVAAFPGTEFSNQAYFYIGNAHYKLGAYNRAIEAFSKVGTAVSETEQGKKQIEMSKRLFIRVSDIDLVSLPEGSLIIAEVASSGGDKESVRLNRVGAANSANYLGELDTGVGKPVPGDNLLQLSGNDTVTITYIDAQTADKQVNIARAQQLKVVYNAKADFMDGAYRDPSRNVVVGMQAYIRVIDLDRDLSAKADTVSVKVLAKRPVKKEREPAAVAEEPPAPEPKKGKKNGKEDKPAPAPATLPSDEPETARIEYKVIDEVNLTLVERPPARNVEAKDQEVEKTAEIHSGVFGGQVLVMGGDVVAGDAVLQVQPGDILEIRYNDEINTTGKAVEAVAVCQTVQGSAGEVAIRDQQIRDEQLELQTRLKTAEALTNIGKIYKQLGLKEQANQHFEHGVQQCELLARKARNLGGEVLETMYVRLWKLYLELDQLDKAAAMCLALQREFPNSQFVDEALLGLGETSVKKGEHDRAIAIFRRVLELPNTQRKADALFAIGACQEELAKPKLTGEKPNQGMLEAAFLSYQRVFQTYPESGVAGDAVSKMAEYYMSNKEYDRAVSTFQQALEDYPDASFADRVLYDYGRCLYRMQRVDDAMAKFRQLMSEYPQSKWAGKAKQIIQALEKRKG